jgi:hypothetical protein
MFTKEELEEIYVKAYFHNMDIMEEENNIIVQVLSSLGLFANRIFTFPYCDKTQEMAENYVQHIDSFHEVTFSQMLNQPEIKSYPCPCLRKKVKDKYNKLEQELEKYVDMNGEIKDDGMQLYDEFQKYQNMMENYSIYK